MDSPLKLLLARNCFRASSVWISKILRHLTIDNSDGDDGGGNNIGARRTNSKADSSRSTDMVGNSDTDKSIHKGSIRSNPVQLQC